MIKEFKKYLAIGTILSPLALNANAADFWALGQVWYGLFNPMTADGSKIIIKSNSSPNSEGGLFAEDTLHSLYDISNPAEKKLIKSHFNGNQDEYADMYVTVAMSPNGEYIIGSSATTANDSIALYNFMDGTSFTVGVGFFHIEAISNNGIAVDGGGFAVNLNDQSVIKLKAPLDENGKVIFNYDGSEVLAYGSMISDDGSTIIGIIDHNADGEWATKWDASTGDYTYLKVAAGFKDSYASASNADGSIIAGATLDDYNNATKSQLVLWKNGSTQATVIHEATGSIYRLPTSMTASGHVFVGGALSTVDEEIKNGAFFWTEKDGVTPIAEHLKANNVALTQHSLDVATSISDDGTLVSGTGEIENIEQAWLARISPNTSTTDTGDNTNTGGGTNTDSAAGLITLSDTQNSLFSMGMSAYYMLPTLLADNTRLLGQNCSSDNSQFCAFATASGQSWGESGTDGALSRIGMGYNLTPQLTIGGLIGYHQMDSDNDYSRFTTDGLTAGLWASYNQDNTGLQGAANISYSFGDMDMERFYKNGAKPEIAKGNTSYNALGLSASLGYGFRLGNKALLTPFVDISYVKASIDGFEEKTGLFTASYKDLDNHLWQNHLGVKGRYSLNNKLALLGGLAWGHGMVQDTKVSGALKEATGFGNVEHVTVKHKDANWANISGGIDYKISEQMNVQFSAEGNIGDEYMIAPDFTGQIKFQINF